MEPQDLELCIFRIVAERCADSQPGRRRLENTLGTGFFIRYKDHKALALTCWHVLDPPATTWPQGKVLIEYQGDIYEARILQDKSCPSQDLAVLEVDIDHTHVAALDPEWHRGDRVCVVGFQEQDQSVLPFPTKGLMQRRYERLPGLGKGECRWPPITTYYIEMEGMVFLRVRNGRLCFPESENELDFELEEGKREMKVEGNLIYFCKPKLLRPPQDWWHKDLIPLLDQVDPIVRKAVNLSLPRVIVLGLILDRNRKKMLTVKPSRGTSKGNGPCPADLSSMGNPQKRRSLGK